jgi:23S rRNA (cytosine1962-C5)-methyltransferase
VRISRRAAERIAAGHVWVYASDIESPGSAEPGDSVFVEDARGRFLATALYSPASQIALRVVSRDRIRVDAAFWRIRIAAALEYRRRLAIDGDAVRLIFSEGDFLPGLIVDRYGRYLSIQLLTAPVDRARAHILAVLDELVSPAGIVLRNDTPARSKEGLPGDVEIVGDVPEWTEIESNGLRWTVDLTRGQKTGLFLDQRENHQAAQQYANGRGLDCFTSTGGFALHLARSCESVDAIDASEPSLERAAENARLNGLNIRFRRANVFDFLAERHVYDTIVLDPPAFAKSKAALPKAIDAYREINTKALRMLARGGILITCSCSQHVTESMFLEALADAARQADRTLRILERRLQARDHPVLLTVPETLYLKCIIVEAR